MNEHDRKILKQLKFFILKRHSKRQLWKQWNKYLWMCSNGEFINYARAANFMKKHLNEHEMNIARNRRT